jgi:hypothetical protein
VCIFIIVRLTISILAKEDLSRYVMENQSKLFILVAYLTSVFKQAYFNYLLKIAQLAYSFVKYITYQSIIHVYMCIS